MSKETTSRQRGAQVLALLATGMNHTQIAQALDVSTKTVQRDLDALKPAAEEIASIISRAREAIKVQAYEIERRVEKYVELAKEAKNEAVSLGALQRLDDIDGLVTEKELIRAKGHEQQAITPMFMLPANSQVNVTVTTTSGKEDAKAPPIEEERRVIDVTPSKQTSTLGT